MSKKNEEVKKLFTKQLFLACDIAAVADMQKDIELQEMTSHYIFDLLDWGRRTMDISDSEFLSFSEDRNNTDKKISLTIGGIEKLVEDNLVKQSMSLSKNR